MSKGTGVVFEVSDDDDEDFQPLPLRLSQVSNVNHVLNFYLIFFLQIATQIRQNSALVC